MVMSSASALSRRVASALATTALVALAACGDAEPFSPDGAASPDARFSMSTAEEGAGLATLRRVTARYHRVDVAERDGFERFGPCVETPAGGLGIVYVNLERLFDGELDLSEPDVLFYEPMMNGRLRLAGVEVNIPQEMWEGEDRPSLFGNEFHENPEGNLYGIHIWVWKHNPEGMYAFLHPGITCEFAG